MCFLILVPSRDWNHIFHNYDTKVEKDTIINEDDAHKVVFLVVSSLFFSGLKFLSHLHEKKHEKLSEQYKSTFS